MLYDIIQKYIESASAELNNIELVRERGKAGRMALLLLVVAMWIISEVLYFTTKLLPNLILIDLITILFLAEYMILSTLSNSKFDSTPTYLLTFLLNISLLFIFIFVTGGVKSIFIILPVLYLLLVFIIDSLIPAIISIAVSIIWTVILYVSSLQYIPNPSNVIVIMVISLIFVSIVGIYIQYYNYKRKPARVSTNNNSDTLSTGNAASKYDYSIMDRMKETLTKKEYEIVYYIIKGLPSEEIAEKLFVEETTIKFHLKNIFKKLNITSKVDLLSLFIPSNMLDRFESSLKDMPKNGDDKGNLPKSTG